jgi:serine/threonine-protein kinase
MLTEKVNFENCWSEQGKRFQRGYKSHERKNQKLVFDHTNGLTWQQSGSPNALTYADAQKYIRDLNKQRFAGYKGWRLPLLSEAMSLVRPSKRNGDSYVPRIFDRTQQWIWTADKASGGVAWVVTFHVGYCYVPVDHYYYVRAVRGEP